MNQIEDFANLIVEGLKWFFADELRFFLTMLTILAVVTALGL